MKSMRATVVAIHARKTKNMGFVCLRVFSAFHDDIVATVRTLTAVSLLLLSVIISGNIDMCIDCEISCKRLFTCNTIM
jgi:hypothetical protein